LLVDLLCGLFLELFVPIRHFHQFAYIRFLPLLLLSVLILFAYCFPFIFRLMLPALF